MLRATSVVRKPAVRADKVADIVTLDHEARQKRRATLTGAGGLAFLLDLERPQALADGDAVKLEDGRLVRIAAAPEALLEIRAENPLRLMRLAWHIGNRHTPAEITADAIYIERDHVLAEMVRGQGCSLAEVTRPFEPQRGAYDHGHHHGHDDHGHGHHGHDHGHHDHAHDHAHGHSHEQNAACGCGHHHGHDHGHGHGVQEHAQHDHAHHDHGHALAQSHDHEHDHQHEHEHEHGAGCGCGHHHGHKHDH